MGYPLGREPGLEVFLYRRDQLRMALERSQQSEQALLAFGGIQHRRQRPQHPRFVGPRTHSAQPHQPDGFFQILVQRAKPLPLALLKEHHRLRLLGQPLGLGQHIFQGTRPVQVKALVVLSPMGTLPQRGKIPRQDRPGRRVFARDGHTYHPPLQQRLTRRLRVGLAGNFARKVHQLGHPQGQPRQGGRSLLG